MKKYFALLTAAALTLGLCACGGSAGTSSASAAAPASQESAESSKEASAAASEAAQAETVAGGWTVTDNQAVSLPDRVKEAFEKAAGDNQDLIPIGYIASQVVAGSNYMILCKSGNSQTGYQMVVIYADLQDNASITSTNDFNITDYVNTDKDTEKEVLVGGWSVPEDLTVLDLPQDAQEAFDKAKEGFTGSNIEPMALLATQVVSGTNYAILARVSPVVQDPVPTIDVITIYADLDGNAKFSSFCAIDPTDYSK